MKLIKDIAFVFWVIIALLSAFALGIIALPLELTSKLLCKAGDCLLKSIDGA